MMHRVKCHKTQSVDGMDIDKLSLAWLSHKSTHTLMCMLTCVSVAMCVI